jgi:hypothetical protein
VGDTINFTVNATDDMSGISSISITYRMPVTNKPEFINLSLTNGVYVGSKTISSSDEAETWKIEEIVLYDKANNITQVWNSSANNYGQNRPDNYSLDLSIGNFTVTTQIVNVVSVSLNKTTDSLTVGSTDILSTTVAPSNATNKDVTWASDNTSVAIVDNTGKVTAVSSGTANITVKTEDGGYSASCAVTVAKPASAIQPLPQKYITQNEYWTSNIINGDLYIGPQAVLTINGSVTVNGNIYVLGAIKNYGNLTVTGGIYASQFNWGNSTLYNGTVLMLGGTNYISSIVASNSPIDIPFKTYDTKDNTIIAYDNKANITGATLPIIDLYEDGTKVNYNNNGTFSVDLNTQNKENVNFKLTDVYGNSKTVTYKIANKYFDTNSDSNVDIKDMAAVAKDYNTKSSDGSWRVAYDYNNDGIVDVYDLVMISKKMK